MKGSRRGHEGGGRVPGFKMYDPYVSSEMTVRGAE